MAINDAGVIVGADETNQRAFVKDSAGYHTFEFPGAILTRAFGINFAGQIVGSFRDAAGDAHGFVATPINYAFSSFDVPGSSQTRANDINDAGQIVGYYDDSHGFLKSGAVYTTLDATS